MVVMIIATCRHLWRKRTPIPRHGAISTGRYIELPEHVPLCRACIEQLNEDDPRFVVILKPDPEVGWVPFDRRTGEPLAEGGFVGRQFIPKQP